MDAATLTLAGRSYAIRPLTLKQLRTALPAFARAASLSAAEGVDAAVEILASALSRDHPEATREALLEMEILPAELTSAIAAIARLSGLVARDSAGASPLGEAKAGSSSGAISTG